MASRPLKVGDRVIFARADKHGDKKDNPVWGGDYGYIVGTVIEFREDSEWPWRVAWDNDTKNGYQAPYLEIYTPSVKERAIVIANKVREYTKPYEKWVGLIALIAVIDHFFLKARIRNAGQGFLNKVLGGLDKTIDKLNAVPSDSKPN